MRSTSYRNIIHQAGLLAWCFCLCLSAGVASEQNSQPADTGSIQQANDTVYHAKKWVGRLIGADDLPLSVLGKDSIRSIGYSQLGDLLVKATPLTPLSQGALGQWDGVEILGIMSQDQVASHNGVPIISPASVGYHPLLYAPVAAERIEMLAGTDAIGRLPSLGLAGVNIQRSMYNTARPFTSMWYHQGAGDLVAGHVTFAQNVSKNTSVAANIRRTGARGVYQQTDFDAWNVHLQGRTMTSSATEWILSYDVSTIDVDPWGGTAVDPYASTSIIETLEPRLKTIRESMRRHDVSLTHAYSSEKDSTLHIATTAYASSDVLRRADTLLDGWYAGVMSTIDARLEALYLHGGARLQHTNADSSSSQRLAYGPTAHAWAKATLNLAQGLNIASSLRYDGGQYGGIGYGVAALLHESLLRVKLDASWITEQSTATTSGLYYAHAALNGMPVDLQAMAYYRSMDTPQQSYGLIMTAGTTLGNLRVDANVRGIGRGDSVTAAVTYYASVSLSYRHATAASTVEFGTSFGIIGDGLLPQFDVVGRSYSTLPLVATALQHNGVTIFGNVVVGTASIRASFENLLGTRWYTVAYMPEIPRQFRLSVDWTFVD